MFAVFRKYFFGFVILVFWTFLPAFPVLAAEAVLSWSPNTDSDLAGYVLYYKDDSNSFPLTKTQFTQKVVISSNQTSYTKRDLSEGIHRFALTAFDTSSNESGLSVVVQKTISSSPDPSDTTPPEITAVFVEQAFERSARIRWETDEPATSQIEYRRASDPASETRTSGLNTTLKYTHTLTLTELDPFTQYEYQVFSQDASGNSANSATESFQTAPQSGGVNDTTPPGDLKLFTANGGDKKIVLSWNNPSDLDFEGLQILYRTDRFPENINDGELLADLKGQPDEQMSLTHSGLENGRTYYYLAATYDQAGNFQTTVFAEAVPESSEGGGTAGGGGCGIVFPTSGGRPPGPGDAAGMLLLVAAGFILLIKKALLNKNLRPSSRAFES